MARARRLLPRVAIAVAGALLVVACGSGGEDDPGQAVTPLPTDAATTAEPTPAGYLGEITHPATGPCGATHDPESGRAWVSYANTRQVNEVDPVTGSTISTMNLSGTRPCVLQFLDGFLWVGVFRDNVVQKVDPASGEVVGEAPLAGGAFAMLEAFGHLWVLDGTAPAVVKIDPASAAIVDSIRVEGTPQSIVATDEGIWVVRETPGVVSLISPDPLAIVEEVQVVPGIRGVAAGDGALWVTRARLGTVHRVDLGDRSVGEPISVGQDPRGITFAHGYVWAADVTGQLTQVDPASGQVIASYPFAVGLGGALEVGDQLWIFEPNRIVQIDPAQLG